MYEANLFVVESQGIHLAESLLIVIRKGSFTFLFIIYIILDAVYNVSYSISLVLWQSFTVDFIPDKKVFLLITLDFRLRWSFITPMDLRLEPAYKSLYLYNLLFFSLVTTLVSFPCYSSPRVES